MKMLKSAFVACAIAMLSAFAVASESTALTEAQYELSQAPSDLVVQSENDISFGLTQVHSEAFQVENSEVSKQERSTTEQFLLVDSQHDQLVIVNEVGWRSSHAF
jgi:hypothetical protein